MSRAHRDDATERARARARAVKVEALADALEAAGCDAETAEALTAEGWARAAAAAGTKLPSPTSQAAVIAVLAYRASRPAVEDVFEAIAGAVPAGYRTWDATVAALGPDVDRRAG